MKNQSLASMGFSFGAVCLVLAAIFLIVYFVLRGTGRKPILWLALSAGAYGLSMLGLIAVFIFMMQISIPTMGDFNSVSINDERMTAGNDSGSFVLTDRAECFGGDPGKDFHQVSFKLQNHFEGPVMIQDLKVISRMDKQEVGAYQTRLKLPLRLEAGAEIDIKVSADHSVRIKEHASQENQGAYGLTAYLQVYSSEGKLPGIPIRFPEQACH